MVPGYALHHSLCSHAPLALPAINGHGDVVISHLQRSGVGYALYTDLSSPDIVWIYLADESSPIEKYMQMIPEIKGLHYRLTDEQMNQLTYKDFPEIDGIPAYVFVNRDGTYSLRLDFRDHNIMTNTILKEINNK